MTIPLPPPDWQQAFLLLEQGLSNLNIGDKKVLFFDEFPWLDNHRSCFLAAFNYWWNMYGIQRNDLAVIICGSATTWMINRVVNTKEGCITALPNAYNLCLLHLPKPKNTCWLNG